MKMWYENIRKKWQKNKKKSLPHYKREQWKGPWSENKLKINGATSVNFLCVTYNKNLQWNFGWQTLSRESTLSSCEIIVTKYLETEMK